MSRYANFRSALVFLLIIAATGALAEPWLGAR
jgi:hypothetical protein